MHGTAKAQVFKNIGLIGTGHIGQYMVQGFENKASLNWVMANPDLEKAVQVARLCGGAATQENQAAVDHADIVILAVRPGDLEKALENILFKKGQTVVSVVAGAILEKLCPMAAPAKVIRVLPISCAAINKSPVLIYPGHAGVEELFSLLGQVHVMPEEKFMTPGTALVGAFYAWLFPLMAQVEAWTKKQGIDPETARKLVTETMEGACKMARHQENMSLGQIWETLATPGGISEKGMQVLAENNGLAVWSRALERITGQMKGHF